MGMKGKPKEEWKVYGPVMRSQPEWPDSETGGVFHPYSPLVPFFHSVPDGSKREKGEHEAKGTETRVSRHERRKEPSWGTGEEPEQEGESKGQEK